MIRTLTIIENITGNVVEYSVSGELPVDEAARALVLVAYQVVPVRDKEPTPNQLLEQLIGEPVVSF